MSSDMVMEYNTGSMVPTTKENGSTTKPKAKVPSGMPREMSIAANSRTTWPTGMENILTLTEANTRENSRTMYRKETEKKSGLMGPSTSEATVME